MESPGRVFYLTPAISMGWREALRKAMRMKRAMGYAALVAVVLSGLSSAAWAQRDQVSEQAKQFVHEATRSGIAEVKLGKMATEQAASTELKEFGQQMVTDHTQANDKLKAIAQDKDMDVPTEMDEQHQQVAENLAKLQGADFDRAYIRQMVEDHEKAVTLFSQQAQQGQDADLKAFAAQTLPTLQEHLNMAKQLAQKHEVSQAR
jgi:putative membrane protein